MPIIAGGGKKTDQGVQVVAAEPYAFGGDERTRFVGDLYKCAPGVSSHDLRLEDAIRLHGGSFWTEGAALGDRVSLQVVDPSGVVVSEYVSGLPVPPSKHGPIGIQAQTAALVPAGLFLRVQYENTGADVVTLGVLYQWLVQPER